jgi:hypothetical protein
MLPRIEQFALPLLLLLVPELTLMLVCLLLLLLLLLLHVTGSTDRTALYTASWRST